MAKRRVTRRVKRTSLDPINSKDVSEGQQGTPESETSPVQVLSADESPSEVDNSILTGEELDGPLESVLPKPTDQPNKQPELPPHITRILKMIAPKFPDLGRVQLAENLPRDWEQKCFASLRKGKVITLTGALPVKTGPDRTEYHYTFKEGERYSYCVRECQIEAIPETKSDG